MINALLTIDVPGAVYVLWWILLAVGALAVLPALVYMLHRTLRAARHIERYFAETLESGVQIAQSTSAEPALTDTIAVATTILDTAGAIEQKVGAAAQTLAARVQ